jgi:hypothetical protein
LQSNSQTIILLFYQQIHLAFKSSNHDRYCNLLSNGFWHSNAIIVCKDLARFLFSVLRHHLYKAKKFIQFMHRLYENHKARLHSLWASQKSESLLPVLLLTGQPCYFKGVKALRQGALPDLDNTQPCLLPAIIAGHLGWGLYYRSHLTFTLPNHVIVFNAQIHLIFILSHNLIGFFIIKISLAFTLST